MSYFSILLLTLALSVDACVVSFSYGLKYDKNRIRNALSLALITGIFQAIMPVLGYFLTNIIRCYIQPYSKIIVFLIFTYLGVKCIIEAFQTKKEETFCIDMKCLILIGIATSIDAFSAGIMLSLLKNKILIPVFLIGIITFINSLLGFYVGGKFKHLPSKYLEILAGVLLIILGFI